MAAPRALRQIALWVIGLAIVVLVASRVPFDSFRHALGNGPHLTLAIVDFVVTVAVLATDTFATRVGLAVVGVPWTFVRVLAIRGATYVLALLNYAVGQVGLGYYLHRTGQPTARAVGITLFLTGTTFATLLVLTTASWAVHGAGGTTWWTLVAICGAFVVYLAVVVAAPRVIAARATFAPLVEAKLGGHAMAIAARIPHVVLLVLGYWFAMRAWGLEVPLIVAATVMPAVVIATVLPISPAGLGTTQAALVYLFADYAPGATGDERSANVLAFAVVHFVYGMLGQLVVGLACTALLRRQDRETAS